MSRLTCDDFIEMADTYDLGASYYGFSPKISDALRQAADAADDAERWREFIRCGWPVCFLGETYDNASDLNTAVDTARKEPK